MSKLSGHGYEMVALGNRRAEITMYGVIGFPSKRGSLMAADFKNHLDSLGPLDEIDFKINSPGGSVSDGIAMYNHLNRLQAKLTGTVDGVCGSIASVVAMALDELQVAEGAYIFIHDARTMFMEDEQYTADELRKLAETSERTSAEMRDIYSRKTGLPREKIAEMMKAETWMNGEQAVAMHFATSVAKVRARRAACIGFDRYVAKIPDDCKALFEPEPVIVKHDFGKSAKAKLFSMKAGLGQ